MLNYFSPSYAEWKSTKTAGSFTAYYIQYDLHYVGILVDKADQSVFRIDISRDGKDPNMVDFETTIKPTAVLKSDVDTAISKALE